MFPTRRSKPRMIPACCRTPRAPLTAGKPAGGQKHRWLSSQGSNGWRVTDSSLRARDASGLADLRRAAPNPDLIGGRRALQDFDKPRCREASRPVGPHDPLASRAPSVLAGAGGFPNDGVPGAANKQGGGALAV
jgi:hypothetical protein